jgi:hypothetical protein
MRPESFQHWNQRRPFQPYRVVCTDGTVYEIRHPEMAVPTRSEVVVGLRETGGGDGPSTFVSYFHVLRIELLTSTAASEGDRGPDENG